MEEMKGGMGSAGRLHPMENWDPENQCFLSPPPEWTMTPPPQAMEVCGSKGEGKGCMNAFVSAIVFYEYGRRFIRVCGTC
eukprot:1213926-Amorphochlora_amoeboformis.AAC.1